jgi:cyanophycinase
LNAAIRRGVPIGGTSAGLAVQGEYIYSAQKDPPAGPDLRSTFALADPFQFQVVIAHEFLENPALADTVTDTHFVTRDRMGRLSVFMARILASGDVKQIKGIGIDEQTSVLIEPEGRSSIVGKGAAYFLYAATPAPVLKAGTPLSIHDISVQKSRPEAASTCTHGREPRRVTPSTWSKTPSTPRSPTTLYIERKGWPRRMSVHSTVKILFSV